MAPRSAGLFVDFMIEGDVLTDAEVYSRCYVPVPEGWHRFEVPYGLAVQVPSTVRLWGIDHGPDSIS